MENTKPKQAVITVRMTPELHKHLKATATEKGESLNDYCLVALGVMADWTFISNCTVQQALEKQKETQTNASSQETQGNDSNIGLGASNEELCT